MVKKNANFIFSRLVNMSSLFASQTYLILDPTTVSDRPPSGGIDTIVFRAKDFSLPKRNFTNIGLRSMVLDNEYYNIVDDAPYGLKNNVITLDGVDYDLIPGNYDATSFLAMLVVVLDAAGPGTFTASYDPNTNLFTIDSTVAFTLNFGPRSPYIEMGFLLGSTVGPSTSITSVVPINLSGPPNLLIYIPEIDSGSMLYYNGCPYHFMYPLTGQYPSLSQGNVMTLGKLNCGLVGFQQLDSLTVNLYYTRGGKAWPYVAWSSTMYQMMLEFS